MTKAIFIVGLPGAGKSFHAHKLAKELGADLFDDFKANAIGNCSHFPFARFYIELINNLRLEKNSIVSDIDFCITESRDEACLCVEQMVPNVEIEWVFFENNPEKCRANINHRAKTERRKESGPINALEKYSKIYIIPEGANVLQIWDGG